MRPKEIQQKLGIDADLFVAHLTLTRNLLVRELKRRFEPVDFRCWKSIFRW